MIDALIICSTVLIITGSILWFGNKFLTTAATREAQLAAEIKARVAEQVAEIEGKVQEAHEKVDAIKAKVEKDVAGLFENQKNLTTAIAMNSPRQGFMQKLQEMQAAGKK